MKYHPGGCKVFQLSGKFLDSVKKLKQIKKCSSYILIALGGMTNLSTKIHPGECLPYINIDVFLDAHVSCNSYYNWTLNQTDVTY